MDPIPLRDLLASPWSYGSPIGRLSLLVQAAGVLLWFIPEIRSRYRGGRLAALLVGPPLLWVLFEVCIGTILSLEVLAHIDLSSLFHWFLRVGVIISATVILQGVLAIQYVDRPISAFPVFGVILGLTALLTDIVFVLAVVNAGLFGGAA